MNEAIIHNQPIALYQLLKFAGLVASGGEAKHCIDQGLVTLNGVVETQKRKKIMAGDIVGIGEHKICVVLEEK